MCNPTTDVEVLQSSVWVCVCGWKDLLSITHSPSYTGSSARVFPISCSSVSCRIHISTCLWGVVCARAVSSVLLCHTAAAATRRRTNKAKIESLVIPCPYSHIWIGCWFGSVASKDSDNDEPKKWTLTMLLSIGRCCWNRSETDSNQCKLSFINVAIIIIIGLSLAMKGRFTINARLCRFFF